MNMVWLVCLCLKIKNNWWVSLKRVNLFGGWRKMQGHLKKLDFMVPGK